MAGVDLREDCFSHGQLYVACSRVSSADSLTILQPQFEVQFDGRGNKLTQSARWRACLDKMDTTSRQYIVTEAFTSCLDL
ncbi:hypothetical protein J6590_024311 [Homalodisca vitripennis]|nr:hypothetical protein J6590_024311 [Homalodisca vitripennis]